MPNDIIHDCAVAYSTLMKDKYELTFEDGNNIKKIDIIFEVPQFKHLTGVQHLEDTIFPNIDSTTFYNRILASQINESDLTRSSLFNNDISPGSNNNIVTVSDRIRELTKLQQILENIQPIQVSQNIQPSDFKLYECDPKKHKANYLIEVKNSDGHLTSIFLIQDKTSKTYNAKSLELNSTSSHKHLSGLSVLSFKQIEINPPVLKKDIISISASEMKRRENLLLQNRLDESVDKEIKKLKDARQEFLRKDRNKPKYIEAKDKFANFIKNLSSNELEYCAKKLYSALKDAATKPEKENLIQQEINMVDPNGIYKPLQMSTNNNISINGSGAAVLTPVATISLSEQWNNFKNNFKLTLQSLGKDIKNLGSDIKNAIGKAVKEATKPSGKYEIADRSAEIEKPAVDTRKSTIDRSNKPNLQRDTLKSKQKEVNEYKKEHTVSPQQHNKNKGRDI